MPNPPQLSKILTWQNPLDFAQKIADSYSGHSWCLLYSGLSAEVKNSRSHIALFPQKKIISDDFFAAEKILKNSEEKWFGYLSYEVAQQFENLPKVKKPSLPFPKIHLVNFSLTFEFDHDRKTLTAFFSDPKQLDEVSSYKVAKSSKTDFEVSEISSNFSDESYLKSVSEIKKKIELGDCYQSNLTRKFFGKFSKKLDQKENFRLFSDLTKLSPANYSSFFKLDENYLISSSPELFLKIEKNVVLSRPIKGTASRSEDLSQDKKNKSALKNSVKERAENLMIVDLVRNDLSKVCEPGSVVAKKLFEITSYKNIHHMSSEIHGEIGKKFSMLDVVRACFPPGSMTGAPKIKAMEIAAKKEKIERGIYSGAVGFFDGNSGTNLAVVIRTLLVQGEKFEFQTGGAITFDSNPQSELEEIFSKAKAILKLLTGI